MVSVLRKSRCVLSLLNVRLLIAGISHVFQIFCVYLAVCLADDYITKLCRRQTEVIQNHENKHVRGIGQGESKHRKYKRL
jgi:hypothetical protein